MGISVVVGGVTRNSMVAVGSLSIEKRLADPATAQMTLYDPAGSIAPVVGNSVEVIDASTVTQFFGTIDSVDCSKIADFTGKAFRITATDNTHATTRRLTGEVEWIEKTVLEIVTDIVSSSLSDDLTDISFVETGPTIPNFRVAYAPVNQAFNALAELAGMRWYTDAANRLHFFTPSSPTAPFSITDGSNVQGLSIRETREDYVNVVVARVGSALRNPDTETFPGDGSATSFTLTYPVGQAPTVLVNGVEKTVGVADVDTGKDWYWALNSKEIRQDSGGTVLTGSDTLSVTYLGIEQVWIQVTDTAEISARATAENNSGRYEKTIEIEEIITQADATARAQAYLDRYSSMTFEATIQTNEYLEPDLLQLEPGDILTISATGYNTTGNFLVQSIALEHMDGATDQDTVQWAARINAVKGPVLRSFVDMLKPKTGGDLIGGASALGSIGGAGVFHQEVTLSANTTINAAYSATKGAVLTMYVIQGSGPYTITFNSSDFGGTINTSISAANGGVSVFSFVGRDDGKWWPLSFPMQDIQ